MSFQVNVPPSKVSQLAKKEEGSDDGEEVQGKKREDYKKLKELEEMRKAGTAPAMKDEFGKDINPHIPQYIMQAPWYYGADQATLRHQRVQPDQLREFNQMNEWYKKGVKEGPSATKYRKGACENCGAMTHQKKDCLERPRKSTAKYTNSDIAPDEYIQPNLDFEYDAKRDRWNGFDTNEHKKTIEEYHKVEEAKKILKVQKLDNELEEGGGEESQGSDNDEDKYAEDVDMPGQKFETKQRITVRNLRIREDTAKYLYNLNVNSSHYDPKTRSMRENPFAGTGKDLAEIPYAGDNFVRISGDAMNMSKQQLFAWEAYEKGGEVHLQADPTKLEILAREFKKRKEDYKTNVKDSILDKYGGEEHLDAPPKQLLLAQTEDYVEYSRHGTVIKGAEMAKIKSRYEEDVYLQNHTQVWGSFWKDGKWGFKCCQSTIKESYCTGEAGKAAEQTALPAIAAPGSTATTTIASSTKTSLESEEPEAGTSQTNAEKEKEIEHALAELVREQNALEKKKKKKSKKKKRKKAKKMKRKKKRSSSSDSDSSEDSSEDEDEAHERKIQEYMKKEEERVIHVDKLLQMDERKRPYNSMYNEKEISEEEMEAFRRKKVRDDDPMANFL